jgi:hypothetical protein
MRSLLAPFLVVATVACSSLGPSALAESADAPPRPGRPFEPTPAALTPRLELVDDDQRPLPTFVQAGRRFVLGDTGERYSLRIINPTAVRVEAVVSVDGLDAVDGRPAGLGKRGYLIAPYGEVTIDGWRTSLDAVAAFRFSAVRASYAARTKHDQNVGVIGVAFFRERPVIVRPPAKASRAAPAAPPATAGAAPSAANESRPGLGTQFGEEHASYVTEEPFERASATPDAIAEIRYDDRDGLVARGIRIPPRDVRDEENERRDRAQAFPEARFAQPPR